MDGIMEHPTFMTAHVQEVNLLKLKINLLSDLHYHPMWNVGIITRLATRAIRISNMDHLEQEKNHLKRLFWENGYKENQMRKTLQKVQEAHEACYRTVCS